MCGRFTLSTPLAIITGAFPWLRVPDQIPARYNIAPSQAVPGVMNDGTNGLTYFQWGLIPSWAKDPKIGNKMINARAETLAEKPAYRKSFQWKRCLVFADGFYEWRKVDGGKKKIPYCVRLKSGEPFAFAGLWDVWRSADGSEVPTCTIITCDSSGFIRQLHDRMPVILHKEDCLRWITPGKVEPTELQPLLAPYPAEELRAYPVSTVVNSPMNETEDCAKAVGEELSEEPTHESFL